jgi:hypothetical protein
MAAAVCGIKSASPEGTVAVAAHPATAKPIKNMLNFFIGGI